MPATATRPQAGISTPAATAPIGLTGVLTAVLLAATLFGLLVAGTYRETPAREFFGAALRGQDLLTLLTIPVLLWTTLKARRGSLRAHIVALGILLYVPYTYLMYAGVPYNDAFLLYVAAIGLGAYLLVDGLLRVDVRALEDTFANFPRRGLGWFLMITGGVFGLLWLAQNLSVLPGGVPEGLFVYDIPSVVHVLDLAFVLPLVIATGALLLRAHPAAPLLASVLLVKMLTLGSALLFMNAGVALAGGAVNAAESAMWTTIIVVSGALLATVFRRMGPEPRRWLRPSIW